MEQKFLSMFPPFFAQLITHNCCACLKQFIIYSRELSRQNMDRMLAMLEMKGDLLPMYRIIGRDWFCSLMLLKRLVTQER